MDAALDSPGDFDRRRQSASAGRMLGMSAAVDRVFRDALAGPSGLVLIAGPAGSGKAATIESALTLHPGALIAGALSDRETADMAVQAALTGALVVAAVDARDAVGALTRLRQWAVEPFLIAATLRAIFAQRLAPRLCESCREPVQAAAGLAARLGFDPGTIVFRSGGCVACGHLGQKGRIGLFEAIQVDMAMRRLIGAGGDEAVIASHAFRDRPNLAGAARAAVCGGAISAEDALKLS